MIARIRKSTICIIMVLSVLMAIVVTTTVHAASPFWGAKYISAGQTHATVYVENVSSKIGFGTAKTWDFSNSATFVAEVYAPSGKYVGTVMIGTNTTQKAKFEGSCSERGTYRVEFYRYDNTSSGGWVGCWLY